MGKGSFAATAPEQVFYLAALFKELKMEKFTDSCGNSIEITEEKRNGYMVRTVNVHLNHNPFEKAMRKIDREHAIKMAGLLSVLAILGGFLGLIVGNAIYQQFI